MYAEICPAYYVDCISLCPVLLQFLRCPVPVHPQEAKGIVWAWHLQFLASVLFHDMQIYQLRQSKAKVV